MEKKLTVAELQTLEAQCANLMGSLDTAIRNINIMAETNGTRELSMVRTKIDEAIMWLDKYERCCLGLERRNCRREQLRKERSATLKLLQRVGIDTTDWARVNAFCLDRRIAGKEFARIGAEEHPDLRRKLRSIEGKGGLGKHPAPAKRRVVIIPTHPGGEA